MPELPEVEVIRRGITTALLDKTIKKFIIRFPSLRFPIPQEISQKIINEKLTIITRRGKYLLLPFSKGTLLIHLGMSGRLTEVPLDTPAGKHDHIDIVFEKSILRYTDARRFGCFLWDEKNIDDHPLLKNLGPEPFSDEFNADYFYQQIQRRKIAIKILLMNASFVVGVGNIYASEALFRAKISPTRPANELNKKECAFLVKAIQQVLQEAIEKGGSTLRDYYLPDGQTGYFQHTFAVYDREGKLCIKCTQPILKIRQAQRSTFFCGNCQK